MEYNQDLIVKWKPLLIATNCQEELKPTLATCCEVMTKCIQSIKNNSTYIYGKETQEFLDKYSIPILANVITNMNAFRIVDRKAMHGPIDKVNGLLVEARTNVVCNYTPIGQDYLSGKMASYYDINALSNLIINRLDVIIVTLLKEALSKESTSINRFDMMDIEPSEYHTAIISSGVKKWAFKHNGRKNIRNDQMQALCPSDYINDGKTELLIDNSSTYDYIILGNVGHGGATYCPYMPLLPEVQVIDGLIHIRVRTRFGMAFNNLERYYKMYKVVD